jgi:hypothetical protein
MAKAADENENAAVVKHVIPQIFTCFSERCNHTLISSLVIASAQQIDPALVTLLLFLGHQQNRRPKAPSLSMTAAGKLLLAIFFQKNP